MGFVTLVCVLLLERTVRVLRCIGLCLERDLDGRLGDSCCCSGFVDEKRRGFLEQEESGMCCVGSNGVSIVTMNDTF